MSKPNEGDGIATVIEVDQTPRRNVRRKLIQSTLAPHKSECVIVSNGDPTCDFGNKEEGEGGDGDFSPTQGKRTRKPKERTPKSGPSKKVGKRKSPRKSTPKKSATKKGIAAAFDKNAVPNLRLEEKLRAEKDSVFFAGKQLHPFFLSCKGVKKNQEASVAENGKSQVQKQCKSVTIGPIHVFEKFQDGYGTIDWRNWNFCEQSSTIGSTDQQKEFNSLEPRSKEFDLNELPILSRLDECVIRDKEPALCASQSEGNTEVSSPIIAYQEKRGYIGSLGVAEVDCEVREGVNLANHTGCTADSSHELQSISCQKSDDFRGQHRNSLWVDKYQPRSAPEVCGNSGSVKLINEWLCLWHERGFRARKDILSCGEEKSLDADYNCSENYSDSENIGAEDYLKKILLITGPVGSGKSAAVHACAKEQGFKVLESNASECRSGTVVMQRFGEALKSNSLSRSLDPLFNSCTDDNGVEDMIEVEPVLNSQNERANLKPLILFEDVDICFAEDRGLFSAIQQIAEKAKGPVVLTANDKNHGLPDNLDRTEIRFSLPSKEELFSHLSFICAAEEVKVNPGSLEQLTMFCGGDIRRAIMQLQFWFQSKHNRVFPFTARKANTTARPDLFDHEAGHMLLPKIIAWDFPSPLSQLVEGEIAKALSMVEKSNNTMEVFVEEVENGKMLDRFWMTGTKRNSILAKKAAMFRQNTCFEGYDVLEDVVSTPCELSNASFQPKRRKLNVVLSSDSEDEPLSQEYDGLLEENGMFYSYCPDSQNESFPLPASSTPSGAEVSQSDDVSRVPESSYVPETIMDTEAELSPRAVSCGHFDGNVEVSTSEDVQQNSQSKEIYIDSFQTFDCVKNTCERIAESSDIMEDCFKEYVRPSQKFQLVSDECSRIDFDKTFTTTPKPKLDTSKDLVQKTWENFTSNSADLKSYLDSEPVEAPQVLDITHQITNLISEADLTRSRSLYIGALEEPMMNTSGDLNTPDHLPLLEQMTSTAAQQGFCFLTNQIVTTESIPASPATMVADERSQDCLDMKPETHEDFLNCHRMRRLSDIVESIVPTRSHLAVKGQALHEYASFIKEISRADPSNNLSGAVGRTRRQRSRRTRHYLSADLSAEDIAFLGQHSTYREKNE